MTSAPDVRPTGAGDTAVLAAICSSALLSVLVALALPPFLPAISAETGVSIALLGQVPAAASLAAAALGLIGGPAADRYGYRRTMLVGVIAVVLGAAGTAAAGSLATLVLAGMLTAVSRALVQPVGLAIAGTRFTGAARRRAISLTVAAVAGAGVLGVPLLTTVGALFSWRAAFVALGLLAILVAGLVVWALPPDEARAGGRLRIGEILGAYRPLKDDRPTLGLVAANLVRVTGLWCIGIYMAAYLVEEHGLSTQVAGLSFAAFGGGLFLGSLVSGGRLEKVHPRTIAVVCAGTAGIVLGAAMALPLGPAAIMALIFAGAAVNGVGNVATTMLLATASRAGRATTMTLNQAAFSLAGAAGGAIGGALLALGGYWLIGVASPAFGCAAALLAWLSRGHEPSGEPEAAAGSNAD